MPRGVKVTIYAPLKWNHRPIVVLDQHLWVDGVHIKEGFKSDCMSSGWYIWWAFPPISPEFKRVLLHDKMRGEALNLKERWLADSRFMRGIKKDGVSKIRRCVLSIVYVHSVYRTVHLYFKDKLGIKRKVL